jgi:uncharacterized alpha-E superfamily protein
MFRRTLGGGVSGPSALRFLLRDPQFPRSVEHCLTSIARSLLELPRCQEPMAACADVQKLLEATLVAHLPVGGRREYVEELQVAISSLHARLADTYFHMASPSPVRSAPGGLPPGPDRLPAAPRRPPPPPPMMELRRPC